MPVSGRPFVFSAPTCGGSAFHNEVALIIESSAGGPFLISRQRSAIEQPSWIEAETASRQSFESVAHSRRVVELDLETDGRYNAFVASHPKATVFHNPGWLNSLQAEYETGAIVLGCENSDHHLEGVMPLLRTRGMPFNIGAQQTRRRLSSLPRTPLAGPLFTSEESVRLLLKAAADRADRESGTQLQIKLGECIPTSASHPLLCTTWRPTYVLEVPDRPEDLRFGDARNRHNLKWAVKKAEKNGVTVRPAEQESELLSWYPLYLQTMRRNCVPARPLRLFRAMWNNFRSLGLICLQLAEQCIGPHKRLIAGSIFLRFNDTLWYAFTGVDDSDLSLHANDLILWKSIHDACGTGVRWLDLGEVSEDHPELLRFKTKWGASPRPQYRYYSGNLPSSVTASPPNRNLSIRVLRRLWQRLPLWLTAQLGDLIYSRL
jgi:hypothetical protein